MRKGNYGDSSSRASAGATEWAQRSLAHFRDVGRLSRNISPPLFQQNLSCYLGFRTNRLSQGPVRLSRRQHSPPRSPGGALEEGATDIGTRGPLWE